MRPGSPEASALANASRELLNAGDPVGAERVLAPVFHQLQSDAAALHLMGLIKRAQNQIEAAERCFRRAIAHAFDEGGYYNDLGVVLQAQRKYDEAIRVFRAALALTPKAATARINLIGCLMEAGQMAEAEREAQAFVAVHPGAESWTLLGKVQRSQDRHQDALASASAALKYGPQLRGLRYNYATALERLGRTEEALDIYEKLARQELDSADLAISFARALYVAGRKKDAEAVAERGVQQFPGSSSLHAALARMRWLRGEGEKCVALLEEAIAKRPQDLSLRLTCADALHRAQAPQKAAAVLDQALRLAPDATPLLTAMAVVLDDLDRSQDALKLLRRAAELSADTRTGRRNLLSTLLRAGQPEEALRVSRELQAEEPDEQYLIACESVALRMLGDAGYRELCDYDRLVRTYEIAPPRGFFTAENFNASLADVLRAQHRSNAHPLDQHIANGSQTGRSLLLLDDHVIKSFVAAIDAAVRDYIKGLPPESRVGRRRSKHYRYGGLWSTRLTDGGYLANHVHDRGWIASAYYAALMPAERPNEPRNGWLKLGEPNKAPPNCGPEKLIEPRPGLLVLFPAYMWHGTIPFEGSERLSAAFDVQPS
jgi:tetratricopeptide (TPR) repeat protein